MALSIEAQQIDGKFASLDVALFDDARVWAEDGVNQALERTLNDLIANVDPSRQLVDFDNLKATRQQATTQERAIDKAEVKLAERFGQSETAVAREVQARTGSSTCASSAGAGSWGLRHPAAAQGAEPLNDRTGALLRPRAPRLPDLVLATEIGVDLLLMAQVVGDAAVDLLQAQGGVLLPNGFRGVALQEGGDNRIQHHLAGTHPPDTVLIDADVGLALSHDEPLPVPSTPAKAVTPTTHMQRARG